MKKVNNYIRFTGQLGTIVDERFDPTRHNMTQEEWDKLPDGYIFKDDSDKKPVIDETFRFDFFDFGKKDE